MAKFDELQEKVDKLNKTTSNDSKFKSVFEDIQDAVNSADDDDIDPLVDIVGDFRDKLPGRLTLNRVRADAKDLDEALTLGSIDATINQISLRNDAIANLISALDEESEKAVDDASLLDEIKEGIEKATKTIAAIKSLVNKLEESDDDAIENIESLIDTVDDISSIFDADDN